ncbi:hypothetical protein D3C84_735300 [compost metagenome]
MVTQPCHHNPQTRIKVLATADTHKLIRRVLFRCFEPDKSGSGGLGMIITGIRYSGTYPPIEGSPGALDKRLACVRCRRLPTC